MTTPTPDFVRMAEAAAVVIHENTRDLRAVCGRVTRDGGWLSSAQGTRSAGRLDAVCDEHLRGSSIFLRLRKRFSPKRRLDSELSSRRSLMAKPRPGKKREKNESVQPPLPGARDATPAGTTQFLPMQLRIDRLTDETGASEVIGRPYTTAGGKSANVRVKRVGSEVTMIRVWNAHERVAIGRR